MDAMDSSSHVQAKLFTKQEKYAVPDVPFSVPATVGTKDLTALIHSMVTSGAVDDNVQFDFLINGEFLLVTLNEHMEQKEISTETVLEIEYVERHPAPEPEDSLHHDDWVAAVHTQADYILTGSYDNTVRVWNTTGDQLIVIPGHTAPVKSVAWVKSDENTSEKSFLTGGHDEVILLWQWNQTTNCVDCTCACRGHAGSVDSIAVDPTKTKFCSGSWDKMLKFWSAGDVEKGEPSSEDEPNPKKKKTDQEKIATRVPVMTLTGHTEGVSAVQWMSDTEICSASWDHTIRLWDVSQAAQTSTISGPKVFLDLSYSPFNKLIVTAAADRHVRLYDPRTEDGALVKTVFTSHNRWVTSVAWSPTQENQFISGSYDFLLKLWDIRSPKAPLYDLTGHKDKILDVDWSMPQYMVSAGADNAVRIFRHNDKSTMGIH